MKLSLIMKSLASRLALALLLALSMSTGCRKKASIDTVKLQYVQAADSNTQSSINEAVESIDKADYAGAQEKLKKAAADPKLTPEQKTADNDVLLQLEKR